MRKVFDTVDAPAFDVDQGRMTQGGHCDGLLLLFEEIVAEVVDCSRVEYWSDSGLVPLPFRAGLALEQRHERPSMLSTWIDSQCGTSNICVCVCVCACVRARARACMRACAHDCTKTAARVKTNVRLSPKIHTANGQSDGGNKRVGPGIVGTVHRHRKPKWGNPQNWTGPAN